MLVNMKFFLVLFVDDFDVSAGCNEVARFDDVDGLILPTLQILLIVFCFCRFCIF